MSGLLDRIKRTSVPFYWAGAVPPHDRTLRWLYKPPGRKALVTFLGAYVRRDMEASRLGPARAWIELNREPVLLADLYDNNQNALDEKYSSGLIYLDSGDELSGWTIDEGEGGAVHYRVWAVLVEYE